MPSSAGRDSVSVCVSVSVSVSESESDSESVREIACVRERERVSV